MNFGRLDRIPPLPAAAVGLTLGLLPLGLLVVGQTAAGVVVGLSLAAGGWWIAARRSAAEPTPARTPRTSSFADARPIAAAPDPTPRASVPPVIAPLSELRSSSAARRREPRPKAGTGGGGVAAPATPYRPALVPIPPGEFVMGSPESGAGRGSNERPHRVQLTRGFWTAETEVTQAQYMALMGENPSRFQGTDADGDRPVERVSWLDATHYCNALSAKEGLTPAYTIEGDAVTWDQDAAGYRLPTEAEWEYAARAGTGTATYAGDPDIVGENNAPALDPIAWYGGNSGSAHPKAVDSSGWSEKQHPHEKASTHLVKGKRPNPWGLYDMLGNVWEWIWDRYADYPSAADGARALADPAGPFSGDWRVIRGGSFFDFARYVRAANRVGRLPGLRVRWLGFRPVRFAGPPPRTR